MTNVSTLDDLFAELNKDPEFRAEYRRQKPYYNILLDVIKRRKELNITQKELAARTGTHQSSISRIESGEHDIRLSTLIEIADALEAQVEIKLVPVFYVDDKEYTELISLQASNESSRNIPKSTVSQEFVKV